MVFTNLQFHLSIYQLHNVRYEGVLVPCSAAKDALQEVVVAQVPSVPESIQWGQQAAVLGRAEDLEANTQRQRLTPLSQRRQLQALQGSLVSPSSLSPVAVVSTQDNLQASPLYPFNAVMLMFCQPRVPNRGCILQGCSYVLSSPLVLATVEFLTKFILCIVFY